MVSVEPMSLLQFKDTNPTLSKSRDYLNFKISPSMVMWGPTWKSRVGKIILS